MGSSFSQPENFQYQSLLYKYCRAGHWRRVIKRCTSHPKEVDFVITSYNKGNDNCSVFFTKNTPLHEACRDRSPQTPLQAVAALIKASSFAASVQDRHGWTPLHLACMHRGEVSADLVEILITVYPKAASMRDEDNRTPLHLLIETLYVKSSVVTRIITTRHRTPRNIVYHPRDKQTSTNLVKMLIETCPRSASMSDKSGRTPLHIVCMEEIKGESIEIAELLFGACPPGVVSAQDLHGKTPLHQVCRYNNNSRSVQMAELLIAMDPERGVLKQDNEGRTPLHVVCHHKYQSEVSIQIATLLVAACPKSVLIQDKEGRTPLHMICHNVRYECLLSIEAVEILVAACPEAASVQDMKRKTPLDIICRVQNLCFEQTLVRMVILLVIGSSSALSKQNEKGETPLQVVCYQMTGSYRQTDCRPAIMKQMCEIVHRKVNLDNKVMIDTVNFLREVNPTVMEMAKFIIYVSPENISVQDKNGNTPLHIICTHLHQNTTLIKWMVQAYPKAACIQNKQNKTPLHIICGVCNKPLSLEVAAQLMAACPKVTCLQDIHGNTPLHTICYQQNKEKSVDVAKLILSSTPEAASMENLDGMVPLHILCLQPGNTLTSNELMKTLIDAYPQAVTKTDKNHHSPFFLFCEYYIGQMEIFRLTNNILRSYVPLCEGMQGYRKTIFLLVKGAYVCTSRYTMTTNNSIPMLHATIEVVSALIANLKCENPRDTARKNYYERIIYLALQEYSDQVFSRDRNGNFPLHVVASNPIPHDKKIDRVTKRHRKNIVESILELNPNAARALNKEGKFPLTLAIESGTTWSDGIKSILAAYPAAIAAPDIDECCYHQVISLVSRDLDLDVMHKIVRAKPDLTRKYFCIN